MSLFRFCRFLCWVVAKLYFRFEVIHKENVPQTGGAVLACNHVSFLDPPLSGIALKRETHFFARNSLMKNAFSKWFFHKLNCIPVDRDQLDTKTFREVMKKIKSGELVVMFPEGTRSHTGEIQQAKQGAGMIIHHAQAPVIPCYIDGAAQALPRGTHFPSPKKIRVIYGKPLTFAHIQHPDKRAAYTQIATDVMAAIAELKNSL